MTAAEQAALAEWGEPTTDDLRFLEHLWNGHNGGYADDCPHDHWRCGGQGCRPSHS